MAITINGSTGISGVPAGGYNLVDGDMPSGAVLQVVQTASSAGFSSSVASTWLDTGISVSITPTSASNKVFVLINSTAFFNNSATFPRIRLSVARGSTNIGSTPYAYFDARSTGTIFGQQTIPISISHLDSPSTTSATEYSIYMYLEPVASSGSVSGWGIEGGVSITAMEIAA